MEPTPFRGIVQAIFFSDSLEHLGQQQVSENYFLLVQSNYLDLILICQLGETLQECLGIDAVPRGKGSEKQSQHPQVDLSFH